MLGDQSLGLLERNINLSEAVTLIPVTIPDGIRVQRRWSAQKISVHRQQLGDAIRIEVNHGQWPDEKCKRLRSQQCCHICHVDKAK